MSHTKVNKQNVIKLALRNKTKAVKKALKKFKKPKYSELHNNIARIAILLRNTKMFDATSHHTRVILKEMAPRIKDTKFVVDIYREGGSWDRFDVPRYVWTNASLASAKYMVDDLHSPDPFELYEASEVVQNYFGYNPICDLCDNVIEKCELPNCKNMRICHYCYTCDGKERDEECD